MKRNEPFFDALAMLVSREINAAKKAADNERLADVVAALGEMLGKAIALVGQGERRAVEAMLIAAENMVAEGAAEMSALIATLDQMKQEAGK